MFCQDTELVDTYAKPGIKVFFVIWDLVSTLDINLVHLQHVQQDS